MTDVINNQTKKVFICGSALRGQPDHKNLQSATLLNLPKPKLYIDSMLLKMVGILRSMLLMKVVLAFQGKYMN